MRNPIHIDEIPDTRHFDGYVSEDGEIFATSSQWRARRFMLVALTVASIAIVSLAGPLIAYQLLPGASQVVGVVFMLGYLSAYAALTSTLFYLLKSY